MGEIVGFALRKATGDVHAYVATPVVRESCAATAAHTETRTISIPENLRRSMRQRCPTLPVGNMPR